MGNVKVKILEINLWASNVKLLQPGCRLELSFWVNIAFAFIL